MGKTQKYSIIVSERAGNLLNTHIRFLANVNLSAARKTKNDIIKGIRSLSEMPERFPFLEESFLPTNKYHKMYIENWYLVLYQIKDQTVYVDYIIDCRQDYSWLIK